MVNSKLTVFIQCFPDYSNITLHYMSHSHTHIHILRQHRIKCPAQGHFGMEVEVEACNRSTNFPGGGCLLLSKIKRGRGSEGRRGDSSVEQSGQVWKSEMMGGLTSEKEDLEKDIEIYGESVKLL